MSVPTENRRRHNCPRAADPLPCAVPGWPTLASQRAELRAATMKARNRRRSALHLQKQKEVR